MFNLAFPCHFSSTVLALKTRFASSSPILDPNFFPCSLYVGSSMWSYFTTLDELCLKKRKRNREEEKSWGSIKQFVP